MDSSVYSEDSDDCDQDNSAVKIKEEHEYLKVISDEDWIGR